MNVDLVPSTYRSELREGNVSSPSKQMTRLISCAVVLISSAISIGWLHVLFLFCSGHMHQGRLVGYNVLRASAPLTEPLFFRDCS